MNNVIEKEKVKIENLIYEVRGVQVMLDSDLANLYECTNGTKSINLAVKRHPNRFPERYMFQLTDDEYKNLRFQFETAKSKMSRTLPYVFTETGVAMLATVLKTSVAEKISIEIMDAFVSMRHYIIKNKDIYTSLNNINNKLVNYENKMLKYDKKINYLFSKFDTKEQLFLEGQTYSSYRSILEILNMAKETIIVVDEYADIIFLDLIRNIKCNITLITKDSNRLSNIEIEKYNREYHNLTVVRNNSFHDRFLIVDRKEIYLSGSSINNAGNKTFMIIRIEKESVKDTILNDIDKIINK